MGAMDWLALAAVLAIAGAGVGFSGGSVGQGLA
jgi:hypothetical protein